MMDITKADVSNAALKWCGEKDRETFYGDVLYFENNWSALPGLRRYVEQADRLRALIAQPDSAQ